MILYLYSSTEAPVEFLTPLYDQRVKEFETATFECEVSKPNLKAVWRCGETILEPSDKFEVICDGTKHKLIIKDAELTDGVMYSVTFEENVQTAAALIVDGLFSLTVHIYMYATSNNSSPYLLDVNITQSFRY